MSSRREQIRRPDGSVWTVMLLRSFDDLVELSGQPLMHYELEDRAWREFSGWVRWVLKPRTRSWKVLVFPCVVSPRTRETDAIVNRSFTDDEASAVFYESTCSVVAAGDDPR